MKKDDIIEASLLNDRYSDCLLWCHECGFRMPPKFKLSANWSKLACMNQRCDNHVTIHRRFVPVFAVLMWNRLNQRMKEKKNENK